jgi:hypothetical protein
MATVAVACVAGGAAGGMTFVTRTVHPSGVASRYVLYQAAAQSLCEE